MPASFLMGLALLLGGCGSDIPSTADTSGLTLDCALFQTSVNPIFVANIGGRTCSASGCHTVNGSAGGAFKIFPNAALNTVEMQANYLPPLASPIWAHQQAASCCLSHWPGRNPLSAATRAETSSPTRWTATTKRFSIG